MKRVKLVQIGTLSPKYVTPYGSVNLIHCQDSNKEYTSLVARTLNTVFDLYQYKYLCNGRSEEVTHLLV